MVNQPKPGIRGPAECVVVIVTHPGTQGELVSNCKFVLTIDRRYSRTRRAASDISKKWNDIVVALVLLQNVLELRQVAQIDPLQNLLHLYLTATPIPAHK